MNDSILIIMFAACIHASFQLSISVLTLLSSHAIGSKASHIKLLRLSSSFIIGAGITTMLLICSLSFLLGLWFREYTPLEVWASISGLMIGFGVMIWALYYRKNPGTTLWIPRCMAKYLTDRINVTKHAAEAFGLGVSSVLGEIIFIIIPLIATALVLIRLESIWQLIGVLIYTAISLCPLFVMYLFIGGGHKLSRIQRWRESNKRFIQFATGSAIIVLGFYIYIDQIFGVANLLSGGH